MTANFSALLLLFASMSAAAAPVTKADDVVATTAASLRGTFDNRAQTIAKPATPHVTMVIEPTSQRDFSLWRVHVDTDSDGSFDQTWAMQARVEHDGSGALVPFYQLTQTAPPAASTFDPHQWLSLEACALRGRFTPARIAGASEGEPCVAVTMSVGARRALLPVAFANAGNRLEVDLNLRGERVRVAADRVP